MRITSYMSSPSESPDKPFFGNVADKHGGLGHNTSQRLVLELRADGLDDTAIRRELQRRHFKPSRISQLLKKPAGAAKPKAADSATQQSAEDCGRPMVQLCPIPGGCKAHNYWAQFRAHQMAEALAQPSRNTL